MATRIATFVASRFPLLRSGENENDDFRRGCSCAAAPVEAAPLRAPVAWSWVNAVLFGWSCLLLVGLTDGDFTSRLEETRWYLAWNLGTTVVWCAETGLHLLDAHDRRGGPTAPSPDELGASAAECLLAVYCTIDSVLVLRKWRAGRDNNDDNNNEEDESLAELGDVLVNTLMFGYILVKSRFLRQRLLWREDYESLT